MNIEGQTSQTVQQDQGGNKQSQATQSLHTEGQVPHTVQQEKGGNQQSQATQSSHVDDDVADGQDEQRAGGMKKYWHIEPLLQNLNWSLQTISLCIYDTETTSIL